MTCKTCGHKRVCKYLDKPPAKCPDYIAKCSFPNGLIIKPDGVNELDACVYQDIELHTNCTVLVSRCIHCGNIDISWQRTEETEDINYTEKD